jgi:DNA-directed RNA polymerase specialized sigma24 family protein
MRAVYADLVRTARKWSRRADEAQDLVQDALVEALERSKTDWRAPEETAWLRGVVRRRAAFEARSAVRRRRREALAARVTGGAEGHVRQGWEWSEQMLASLPPSLRVLAVLVAADLTGAEIRWALRLTDTAFRKRLSALRKAVQQVLEDPDATVTVPRRPGFALGALRGELLRALKRQGNAALAAHDPDGHPLIFCFSITRAHGSGTCGNR